MAGVDIPRASPRPPGPAGVTATTAAAAGRSGGGAVTGPAASPAWSEVLAERLRHAREASEVPGWLALETGGLALLVPLREAGGIFPAGPLLTLPHTQPWFLGVTTLRGSVHGVVDLAGFLGRPSGPLPSEGAWLVSLSPSLGCPCALSVQRLLGLRHPPALQPAPGPGGLPDDLGGPCWLDDSGRRWQELSPATLVRDPRFLAIARGEGRGSGTEGPAT